MPTPPDFHAQVKALLFEALDLPEGEREAFIVERCGADVELLEEARSLLRRVPEGDGFLAEPLSFGRGAPPTLPGRIGDFEVLRLLGSGGMGVVYLAQQLQPRRQVAVKVLRLDIESAVARRRFERESEVLARFSHPGLAKVFEAGTLELDGIERPYFCMEHIEGLPLDQYARRHELDVRARVELALEVAQAVAHAHAAGVLHRDLKPENVLVDQGGHARVLDFGVAHLIEDDPAATQVTATGQVLGTVAYMSPEQARGGRVDERTDVFAVGVLLYEMLTGELPYSTRGRLVHEALRVLAEGDWTPASKHDSTLRGDLDAVLGTALASEPARRYRDMQALVRDLEAWLDARPVSARAPSTLYQASRFIARHRALTAGVAIAFLAIGVGLGVTLGAVSRANEHQRVARVFADMESLDTLEAQRGDLWPADSEHVEAMEAWLVRADALASRRGAHARLLDKLSRTDARDVRVREGRRFLEELDAAFAPGAWIDEMQARLAEARERTRVTLDEAREAWEAAALRVRGDARFAGVELAPQEGLFPLGADPVSCLEEFWLFGPSGRRPRRDARTGRLELSEDTGIVMVLIPGGRVWVGTQSLAPDMVHFDPVSPAPGSNEDNEGPPILIDLDPFLLSKYELTQGQWLGLFGSTPSDYEVGSTIAGAPITWQHPVESVTWLDCVELLPRAGLTLPTEAQWESAARAGSSSVFGVADTPDALRTLAKIRLGVEYEDGCLDLEHPNFMTYYAHAPVGLTPANDYGLHDVIGNVWELCLDEYKVAYHVFPHRAGDGLVLADGGGDVSRRGSGWWTRPSEARVAARQMRLERQGDNATGLRPVRTLEGLEGRQ